MPITENYEGIALKGQAKISQSQVGTSRNRQKQGADFQPPGFYFSSGCALPSDATNYLFFEFVEFLTQLFAV